MSHAVHPDAGRPDAVADLSQRHMLRRAQTIGLLMRHSVNAIVSVVAIVDPHSTARPSGSWLLGALGCWAVYRLATRSHDRVPALLDFAFTIAICAAIPLLTTDPLFYASNTAPQAIAGTAVISFAIVAPPLWSLLATIGVALTYAMGSAALIGWEQVAAISALYYFAVQWTTAGLIRVFLLRVSIAVDGARADRHAAAVRSDVATAVRDFEREQLSLLHDTAASTLLLVGQGTPIPPGRLAAQARRDLDVLAASPLSRPDERVELVAALQDCAVHLQTPVRFSGEGAVWLDAEPAAAVVAAAREAMTNVDRHAHATLLRIDVGDGVVVVSDDGVGMDGVGSDGAQLSGRHGVAQSIVGRMARAGGSARVESSPQHGTTVEIRWATAAPATGPRTESAPESSRFAERVQAGFGLALTAYAIVNVAFAAGYAVTNSAHPSAETLLVVLAVLCPLAAVPGLRRGRWQYARPAAAILLAVCVVQPFLLSADQVGGQAEWTQSTIGWCVLPLLLGLPIRTAAPILTGYWAVAGVVQLVRDPSTQTLVNLGLGTASIFAVQLISLLYSGLLREAAADAQSDAEALLSVQTSERVAEALQSEYRERSAELAATIIPLLTRLADRGAVDQSVRMQARSESRRLRMLFDQAALFDHPLLQDLRPAVDEAGNRGIDVAVHLDGELPTLPDGDRARVMEPLERLLARTTTSARVVLTATPERLTASIVCEGVDPHPRLAADQLIGHDDSELVSVGGKVWFTAHHALRGGGEHDDDAG